MAKLKITFKEQVYNKIFNDILDGCFQLDDFLTEKQLIERYNVSKSPVREALVELCNENILRSIPRLGYQIIPITEKDIANATELRLTLEITSFENLIPHFTNDMLLKISQLNQAWWQDVLSGDIDIKNRWKHNSLFHTTLVSFGGNTFAVDVVSQMIRLEWRAYAQMLIGLEKQDEFFTSSTTKPHIEIEKALSKRDFPTVKEILRKDIMTLKNRLFTRSEGIQT